MEGPGRENVRDKRRSHGVASKLEADATIVATTTIVTGCAWLHGLAVAVAFVLLMLRLLLSMSLAFVRHGYSWHGSGDRWCYGWCGAALLRCAAAVGFYE